jgi:hypothetical protein
MIADANRSILLFHEAFGYLDSRRLFSHFLLVVSLALKLHHRLSVVVVVVAATVSL